MSRGWVLTEGYECVNPMMGVIRSRHGIGTNSRLLQQCFQHLPPLSPALTSKSVMFLKIVSSLLLERAMSRNSLKLGGICTDIFAIEFIKTADLSSRLRSISELCLIIVIAYVSTELATSQPEQSTLTMPIAWWSSGNGEWLTGPIFRCFRFLPNLWAGRSRPTRSSLISTALYGAAIPCLPSPVPFPLFLLTDLSIAQHKNRTTTHYSSSLPNPQANKTCLSSEERCNPARELVARIGCLGQEGNCDLV
jgi:hypothetical protein